MSRFCPCGFGSGVGLFYGVLAVVLELAVCVVLVGQNAPCSALDLGQSAKGV